MNFSTLGNIKFTKNPHLKDHTTFKIGGQCIAMIFPENVQELKQSLSFCKEMNVRYFVLGNGSNVLFSDDGFDGIVIKLLDNFKSVRLIDETRVEAYAGAKLADIADFVAENSLTCAEFISGIPGSLGGAIFMNAGAYDGDMAGIVESVEVIYENGEIVTYLNHEMNFGYRKSIIQTNKATIIKAVLSLKKGEKADIIEKMRDLNEKRAEKQPLEAYSAGSTFKRPEGHFAGKLIMDSGLKGAKIGGAEVSLKHCGFVVNTGGATANDVINLIEHIKKTVLEKTGVELEAEVRVER